MSALQIVLGIAMIIISLLAIGIILLQQGRRSGVNGVISGAADTFLSKNKARTVNDKLARITKYVAILFFIVAILACAFALNK